MADFNEIIDEPETEFDDMYEMSDDITDEDFEDTGVVSAYNSFLKSNNNPSADDAYFAGAKGTASDEDFEDFINKRGNDVSNYDAFEAGFNKVLADEEYDDTPVYEEDLNFDAYDTDGVEDEFGFHPGNHDLDI